MNNELIKYQNNLESKNFNIPEERLKLLYFSFEQPKSVGFNIGIGIGLQITFDGKPRDNNIIKNIIIDLYRKGISEDEVLKNIKSRTNIEAFVLNTASQEPSTIFLGLRIDKPNIPGPYDPPGYYPAYANLTPWQRWVYLKWLEDITRPIGKGFAFIYYYGLERQLFGGNRINAAKEMLLLSYHHKFMRELILDSIFISWASSNDEEMLKLYIEESSKISIDNYGVLLRYINKTPLRTKEIFEAISQLKSINKGYLYKTPEMYYEELDQYLFSNHPDGWEFFEKYNLEQITVKNKNIFYNYSLDSDLRTQQYYDFLENASFISDLTQIHLNVHGLVKIRNKNQKRLSKING